MGNSRRTGRNESILGPHSRIEPASVRVVPRGRGCAPTGPTLAAATGRWVRRDASHMALLQLWEDSFVEGRCQTCDGYVFFRPERTERPRRCPSIIPSGSVRTETLTSTTRAIAVVDGDASMCHLRSCQGREVNRRDGCTRARSTGGRRRGDCLTGWMMRRGMRAVGEPHRETPQERGYRRLGAAVIVSAVRDLEKPTRAGGESVRGGRVRAGVLDGLELAPEVLVPRGGCRHAHDPAGVLSGRAGRATRRRCRT